MAQILESTLESICKSSSVTLTKVDEWPKHCPTGRLYEGPGKNDSNWSRWKGSPVVLGKPVIPDPGWICDTPFVWPVLMTQDGIIDTNSEYAPHICIHQFDWEG